MRAARLSTLLEWCAANGIWIDSRLSVEEDAQAGGICIRNVAASLIEYAATRTSRIPRPCYAYMLTVSVLSLNPGSAFHLLNPRSGMDTDAVALTRGIAVVTIPKTAVLSVRSCTLSDDIPFVPCGHGAHLGLALALYGEL